MMLEISHVCKMIQYFRIYMSGQTVQTQIRLLPDQSTLFAICFKNQRTNGPVNAHLISWPSKAQNIQNLENIW